MESGRTSRIFNKIAEVGPDLVRSALGDVGARLVLLFDTLGNHPESDDVFFEDGDLDLCGLMDVARQARSNEIHLSESRLPAMAAVVASEKLRSCTIPGRGGCMARLMRKPLRDAARLTRKPQRLGSSAFMKDLAMRWNCSPRTFESFFKGRPNPRSSPLDSAVAKFDTMGCAALAESAGRLRGCFYDPPSVFGYRRISPSDACCVFAKHYGLDLVREGGIPRVVVRLGSGCFLYSPVVMPLHEAGTPPPHVVESLDEAEHARELFMDAVFDHYLVVMPFRGDRTDGSGGAPNFPDDEEFPQALSGGSLGAVVLGERNGECYFICEWNKLN